MKSSLIILHSQNKINQIAAVIAIFTKLFSIFDQSKKTGSPDKGNDSVLHFLLVLRIAGKFTGQQLFFIL